MERQDLVRAHADESSVGRRLERALEEWPAVRKRRLSFGQGLVLSVGTAAYAVIVAVILVAARQLAGARAGVLDGLALGAVLVWMACVVTYLSRRTDRRATDPDDDRSP